MRWQRSSTDDQDVIDQRGGGGGGRSPLPGGVKLGGGAGILGVIVTLLIVILGGGNSSSGVFNNVNDPFGTNAQAPAGTTIPADQDPQRDLRDFSAYVFSNVQRTWESIFAKEGRPYQRAKLLLYSDAVNAGGCGSASSAVGPFYCPGDQIVYLDLSFARQMQDQLGAPGDFAWAYVIAHEMGHHVQKLVGTERKVRELQRQNPDQGNELSVRLELQADCYAGVWAYRVKSDLEPGDAEEALGAASAVGDDRLQKEATGTVRPDTFTHGTSEQRQRWFAKGQSAGEPADCDTFSAQDL